MTKERKTAIVTVVVLAGALAVVWGQKNGWRMQTVNDTISSLKPQPKADPMPQDTIYAMLDAARAGDVKTYLGNYSGQMTTALQQSISETGEPKFSQYLKDSNSAIKGVAISEPQQLSDTQVKVRVEYVYQDRNEAQFMYLEKQAGAWKIVQVDSTERVKTLVPYGTPVQ